MTVPQAQDAHAAALETLTLFVGDPEDYGDKLRGPVEEACDALALVRSRLVVLEQERAETQRAMGCALDALKFALLCLEEGPGKSRRVDSAQESLRKARKFLAAVSVADIPQEDTDA